MREKAFNMIARGLAEAKRPAVLWSGGKDSTALLHLVRRWMPHIEVIMWKVPWLPEKWEFHDRMTRAWNLTVFDFPPLWSAVCHGNDRVDLMEAYSIGEKSLVVARGTEPFAEHRPWACGRKWLERPKVGDVDFPWDVLFHGHKSCDVDPCSGQVPLEVDVLEAPGCAKIYYPLRDWSDAAVCEYTLAERIPWDSNRYEMIEDGPDGTHGPAVLRTKSDKSLNSDYYHTCLRCIDKRERPFVKCPLSGLVIENLSGRVQEYEPAMAYCNLRTQNGNGAGV
jgi:3'-phosphoadenosine 5'-phosphosulfate sulfotransferase (PAPS reductase)/FAD synthetase